MEGPNSLQEPGASVEVVEVIVAEEEVEVGVAEVVVVGPNSPQEPNALFP